MDIHGKPSKRWDDATESQHATWQPIMLITPARIECGDCGAKAIFLLAAVDADGDLCDGEAYCQDCFKRAQEAED